MKNEQTTFTQKKTAISDGQNAPFLSVNFRNIDRRGPWPYRVMFVKSLIGEVVKITV